MAWRMFIRVLDIDRLASLRFAHALHVVAFGLLALRRRRQNAAGLRGNSRMVLVLVVLEVLTHLVLEWNLATFGAGMLVGMLSGVAVLYVMAFSRALLHRGYQRLTWAGATLVATGIACSFTPPTGATASVGLALLSMSALVLPALCLVLKEFLLKGHDEDAEGEEKPEQTMDVFTVAAVSATGQLLGNLIHGVLVGEQLLAWSAWHMPSGSLLEYVAASWLVRLAIVVALRRTSALAVQTANAVAVPLGGVLFLVPHFSPRLTLGLLTALAGVGSLAATDVWREQPAEPEPGPPPPDPQEVELARRALKGLQARQAQEARDRVERIASWAAEEGRMRAAAEEARRVRLAAEEEAAKHAKRTKVASDAGRAASGAVLAVTSAVAAGATVAAGIAVAAGAVVTAGIVVATGMVAPGPSDAGQSGTAAREQRKD